MHTLKDESRRQSGEGHQNLRQTAMAGFFLLDLQGRILEVSDTYCRLSGYSQQELLTMAIADLEAVETVAETSAHIQRVIASGEDRFESRLRRKSGDIIDVEILVQFRAGEGGRLAGFLQDITDRKKSEKSLRESARRYRLLTENSSDVVWTMNMKGEFTYVSPTTIRLRGYTADEVMQQTLEQQIAPGSLPAVLDVLTRFFAEGRQGIIGPPKVGEVEQLRKDGSTVWTEISAELVKDESDGSLLILAVTRDISERKQAEIAFKDSHRKLEMLWSVASLGDADIRTISDHILVSIKRLTDSDFGFYGFVNEDESVMTIQVWSGEAMKGCSMAAQPQHFPISKAGVWSEAIRQRKPLILNDFAAPHPGKKGLPTGHFALTRLLVVPYTSRGKITALAAVANKAADYGPEDVSQITGFLGNVQAIIERKQAELEKAKIEAQNRQLQKSESLGRMAGAIAHHFNNQLQVVSGNLELALASLPHDAARPAKFLTDAMQATRRTAEVSHLMLTYLGQTSGRQEPLDLATICHRSLTILQAAIPKNVSLNADLPSPGPIVHADANQIQQVLANLVTNAWEAGKEGQGEIQVSVKTVLPADISEKHRFPADSQTRNTPYACLEVADSGSGIPTESIPNLFDPFFSTRFTGRGMGLAVVLGIVRAHKGAITVESALGRGSIFRVYFPVTTEAIPQRQESMSITPEMHGGGKILVVEDEEPVRKMTVSMLRSLGYTVLEAKDGVEALEEFRQHSRDIRCLLCDLTMPRMNGWETLAAVRQITPGIPVILASGFSEAQVMEGEHPERPQAFLGKPYRLENLSEALLKALAYKFHQ